MYRPSILYAHAVGITRRPPVPFGFIIPLCLCGVLMSHILTVLKIQKWKEKEIMHKANKVRKQNQVRKHTLSQIAG